MSSMLQKSILDAKMLQEAAFEEAKKIVAEKYRKQLAESIDKMLEADIPEDPMNDMSLPPEEEGDAAFSDVDPMATGPLPTGDVSSTAGSGVLPGSHEEGDEQITMNLEMLAEMIRQELDEMEGSDKEIIESLDTHEEVATEIEESMASGAVAGPGATEETNEPLFEGEQGCKDCGCALDEECSHYSDLKEEVETLEEKLNSSEKSRRVAIAALNEAKTALKAQLLENTKLVYQNKTLLDESLSEPQRRSLVESISKADSVEKAKTIYEMRSVAGRQKPKSLHENLLSGRSNVSVLQEAKKREPEVDPAFDKMRFLAGIGKKN
jgi:hypothetical protein